VAVALVAAVGLVLTRLVALTLVFVVAVVAVIVVVVVLVGLALAAQTAREPDSDRTARDSEHRSPRRLVVRRHSYSSDADRPVFLSTS